MKRIACPFRAGNRLRPALAMLLAASAVATAARVTASTRPQTGGTLRVSISERIDSVDPRQWPSATAQVAAAGRVESLIFDRLISLDDHGVPQPALALSWQADAQSKRWQFRIRQGVKFSDGTPLTPAIAAMALQQLLGISYDVSATSNSVIVLADHSLPDLPMQLAAGRYFIFYSGENGSLVGTGPFKFTFLTSSGRVAILLEANESCWAGRPFVDKINLVSGGDPEQQASLISFGQADIVGLPASQARRAGQRGVRTASSDPMELFALVPDASRPTLKEVRLRQAISLSIDRTSIADVILQKQGTAAGGLLPNWISGYAHLFPASPDLPRAKNLLGAAPRELSRSLPLVLIYDSGDAEARAVADRVAVNLREVGIMVQVSGQNVDGNTKSTVADLRLVRYRITTPDPATALGELLHSFGEAANSGDATPEQMYAAERVPIDAFRVIPLVHVSENWGLGPQVRDWMAPRWGGWNLADVWLEPPPAAGGKPQ